MVVVGMASALVLLGAAGAVYLSILIVMRSSSLLRDVSGLNGLIEVSRSALEDDPGPRRGWWEVLRVRETASVAEIDAAYLMLARAARLRARSGDARAEIARLIAARDQGRASTLHGPAPEARGRPRARMRIVRRGGSNPSR